MFLSRDLSGAERNYWASELEAQAMIWAVQKTRHLVEQNPTVVIFTDHDALKAISRATSFKTSSADRQNKKLVRASQFLSQYNHIHVRHVPGTSNVGADALSRLIAISTPDPRAKHLMKLREQMEDDEDVDTSYLFHMKTISNLGENSADPSLIHQQTFIYENPELIAQFHHGYEADPLFSSQVTLYRSKLAELRAKQPAATRYDYQNFVYHHEGNLGEPRGLLFLKDDVDNHLRLCVPKAMVGQVFSLIHDSMNHAGLDRAMAALRSSFYVKDAWKLLKEYCAHCPQCEVNRPTRHSAWGLLNPIRTPPHIFHTVSIDFIVKLPESEILNYKYDSILTVTDIFSKAIILIAGREDWNARQWGEVFFRQVVKRWGLPVAIVSDRGSIFVSKFWSTVFEASNCRLLMTTAYHAQSDGQSERTNQTIEICLRHLVNGRQDDWTSYLDLVEYMNNNLPSASTGKSPNEVMYGQATRTPAKVAGELSVPDAERFLKTKEVIRQEVSDSLVFAKARMAAQYDKHHEFKEFNVGDFVNIKYSRGIESGYSPRNVNSRKLAPQRGGRYRIVRRVGKLAYELDLRGTMPGTHPIFSIAHLELAPDGTDPYNRKSVSRAPEIVNDREEWEVKEILAKAIRGRGSNRGLHYLVRWKGFDDPSDDSWEPAGNLSNAIDLVNEFERTWINRKSTNRATVPTIPTLQSTSDGTPSSTGRITRASKGLLVPKAAPLTAVS